MRFQQMKSNAADNWVKPTKISSKVFLGMIYQFGTECIFQSYVEIFVLVHIWWDFYHDKRDRIQTIRTTYGTIKNVVKAKCFSKWKTMKDFRNQKIIAAKSISDENAQPPIRTGK